MFNIPETADARVFERAAKRQQGTFTLVEQDASAPGTILDWINRNFATAPDDKLREAFDTALRWRRSKLPKKNAD